MLAWKDRRSSRARACTACSATIALLRQSGRDACSILALTLTACDRRERKALVAPIELDAGSLGELLIFAHKNDALHMRTAMTPVTTLICFAASK